MRNNLNAGTGIFTSGRDLIHPHIEYLFNMIAHTHAKGIINQIAFNENLPMDTERNGAFGSFHGPSRSLCVNLTAHIANNLARVQDENPNMSIRALIIMELINTALHETHHAAYKNESGDFREIETDDEEKSCTEFADTFMWDVAKDVDINIQEFGHIIDKELKAFFDDLRSYRDNETVKPWQTKQLNMLEKGILYLDEKKEIVLKSMLEVCAFHSSSKGWDKVIVHPFDSNQTEPLAEESVISYSQSDLSNTSNPEDWTEVRIAAGEASEVPEDPTEILPAFQSAEEASTGRVGVGVVEEPTANSVSAEGPTIVPDGYDVLESYAGTEIVADELPEMMASPENDQSQTTTAAETTAPPADVNVQRMAAEVVFRRLFQHIYTKCGWDGAGKFTNAGAVLEAVPIDDIPGVKSLFSSMDTFSHEGAYQAAVEITSHITGLVSKEQLPYYRVHLNIGGQIVRRTFIPQNPDKTKNGQITTWANKVRQGSRIIMLLGDNGPTMHIETEPGQMLGQEKFEIWKQS